MSSSSTNVRPEDVAQLTSMGFSEQDCRTALEITGGNDLEMAINHLLSSSVSSDNNNNNSTVSTSVATNQQQQQQPNVSAGGGGGSGSSVPNNEIIHGSISQYDNPDGRSACTCIALTAASTFLYSTLKTGTSSSSLTTSFLNRMIEDGVTNYWKLATSNGGGSGGRTFTSGVEHLSAEEVLGIDQASSSLFSVQMLPGGIRQGVLSHDGHHPLGMKALLEAIRQEQPVYEWICILVTKTPESILLCFPPRRTSEEQQQSSSTTTTTPVSPYQTESFILIDSHPRPQLGLMSSYAKLHPTLDELIMSLSLIFPPTSLDNDDVPEMMAMMYNSFDLYPLQGRMK